MRGALAAYGQATAVTTSLIGTDLDLAPNVGGDLPTKITFDLVVRLDPVPERDQMVVGQLVDSNVATDRVCFRVCKARVLPIP